MKVKIKKVHPEAQLPEYQTSGGVGMDLVAVSCETKHTPTGIIVEYDTGISIEPPPGHGVVLVPRSSLATKTTLILSNSLGIGDTDFRGSYKFQYRLLSGVGQGKKYEVGDRIGQLFILPFPKIEWEEVQELTQTKRGTGGFGSTDSK